MHIPDGYLSPIFSLGTGVVTVPVWARAAAKVRSVLNNRTVPLLAIFAAFSFTIMMFNIPVPGGTTAHAVGGTLIAVVLGPWAAVLGVSTALIIQALFFGDGGVLAIFANCLNMGVILPFVGYFAYKLIAGNSPLFSTRRVWAAGIGSYIGISASALAVGIELGLQPLLFSQNGHPLYSPYQLNVAIPAMLLSHMLGASLVEALVTALGMAYIQKNHPEFLTSLRAIVSGTSIAEGQAARAPLWQIFAVGFLAAIILLFFAGLLTGGGDVGHLFGADWSQVNWADVATMLLIVALIAVILIPAAYFVSPKAIRRVTTGFMAIAVIAPLGLIAPGFAFGEGSTTDVKVAFGYVPTGLQQLSGIFSAPLAGYNIPLPFFGDANAPLWHAAIGYEISGIIGVLLIGLLVFVLATLLRRISTRSTGESEWQKPEENYTSTTNSLSVMNEKEKKRQFGWIDQTISGIAGAIEQSVFTEEHTRKDGWLQHLDPRAKLGMFLGTVLAASLSNSLLVLAAFYIVLLIIARQSKIPFDFFVKRVWLGIPFFAGVVILPSIFFAPSHRLFDITLGSLHIGPSLATLLAAAIFVARVGVSVSLAVLLILSTPWSDVLKSLQAFHVPQVFILLLSMTYRYIFLFLHTANGMFEARKSRTVGRATGHDQRGWISGSMGSLMNRSFKMSSDVYAAMAARGFTGEVRTYSSYHMTARDWFALLSAVGVALLVFIIGRYF